MQQRLMLAMTMVLVGVFRVVGSMAFVGPMRMIYALVKHQRETSFID